MDKILARPQTHCPPEHFLLTCRVPQVQHWALELQALWDRQALVSSERSRHKECMFDRTVSRLAICQRT